MKQVVIQTPLGAVNASYSDNKSSVFIIHVHGLGEHLGRHKWLAELFPDYSTIQFDLVGHGKSSGERASTESIDVYTKQLSFVLSYAFELFNSQRYFLMGHSLGGLICVRFLQNRKLMELPQRVHLSSPAISVSSPGKILADHLPKGVFNFLSRRLNFMLGGLVDLNELSHNPIVAREYKEDPLTNLKTNLKLIAALISSSKTAQEKVYTHGAKTLITIGSLDRVVDVGAAREFATKNGCEYVEIDQGKHEIHNELDDVREDYFKLIRDFITAP